jgi:hypothetical protein
MWRVATLLLGITACYEPSYRDCEVTCVADTDCAPGHTCSGGLCGGGGACAVEIDAGIDALPSAVGSYAMQLVNRDNGCAFPNWTMGATTTVDVLITQNQAVVVAEPQGVVATFLDAWLGSHVWAGAQSGNQLSLVLAGAKKNKQGKCDYTFDAAFEARLDGDTLHGELQYVARTNNHADCAMLTGCTSRSELSAVRAPQ